MTAAPATEGGSRGAHGLGYMSQLDALRFFAVLGVIAAHNWKPEPLPWIFGGIDWGELGVRLFFVLSGFLITGILLGAGRGVDTRDGRLHVMRQFYVRRFLRIFPIYYLVLVVCLIFAVDPVRDVWPWLFTYTTNVHIWQELDIIDNVGHFWTLAVEEQFYLVWPLLVLFAPRRRLPAILFAVIATAFAYRLYASFRWPADVAGGEFASGTLIFGVTDSLGLGALLAVCMNVDAGGAERWLRDRLLGIALPVGIACYLAMLTLVHLHPGSHLGTMLGPFGGALACTWLIGHASRGLRGAPGRLLELGPLRYLGKISYGIYIFHLLVPLLFGEIAGGLGMDYENRGFANFVGTGVVTVALAALSWHAFEAPLNGLKRRFPYRHAREGPRAPGPRAEAVREGS